MRLNHIDLNISHEIKLYRFKPLNCEFLNISHDIKLRISNISHDFKLRIFRNFSWFETADF